MIANMSLLAYESFGRTFGAFDETTQVVVQPSGPIAISAGRFSYANFTLSRKMASAASRSWAMMPQRWLALKRA